MPVLILDEQSLQLIPFETFKFSGGEIQVKIESDQKWKDHVEIMIWATLHSSDDIMLLGLTVDAIRNKCYNPHLLACIPYIPYGRQDRVCAPGEAFGLKYMAKLLTDMNFACITTFDPHSDVTGALLKANGNVDIITQADIVSMWPLMKSAAAQSNMVLVSPDAGANKKTSEVAKVLGKDGFVRADKLRDVTNGKILETIVYTDNLHGKSAFIVDDICDGGATFIALAQKLKEKGADNVYLYVTHGIFSKGIDPLIKAGIDGIYTTDIMFVKDKFVNDPSLDKVNVLSIEEKFIYGN